MQENDHKILSQLSQHSHLLLLQGPIGHFFSELRYFLIKNGCLISKINFHGGDELFYSSDNAVSYRGTLNDWNSWITKFLKEKSINAIVLFGQCRKYHLPIFPIATQQGIPVYVFEEGYIRPDYITLEQHGVNAYSTINRDPSYYRKLPRKKVTPALPINPWFPEILFSASLYTLVSFLMSWKYPFYQHHRPTNPIKEGATWLLSAWRKYYFNFKEDSVLKNLKQPEFHKKYFFIPLQVHNDSQVQCHSPYRSIEQFIREIVSSFTANALKDTTLVFKHHPMDRGHKNYTLLLKSLKKKYKLYNRLIYIHEGHLPTLLENAKGVVTINSTVGLSAPHHKTPVKLMGDAVYDIPGITSQQSLERFWKNPEPLDLDLYIRFKTEVILSTQLNAGFYTRKSIQRLFS